MNIVSTLVSFDVHSEYRPHKAGGALIPLLLCIMTFRCFPPPISVFHSPDFNCWLSQDWCDERATELLHPSVKLLLRWCLVLHVPQNWNNNARTRGSTATIPSWEAVRGQCHSNLLYLSLLISHWNEKWNLTSLSLSLNCCCYMLYYAICSGLRSKETTDQISFHFLIFMKMS